MRFTLVLASVDMLELALHRDAEMAFPFCWRGAERHAFHCCMKSRVYVPAHHEAGHLFEPFILGLVWFGLDGQAQDRGACTKHAQNVMPL